MLISTLAVVLTGSISPAASPAFPGWQADYAQAMASASAERKPMAVFIGHGSDKVARMLGDGTISAEAARLLRENYVCVFVNTDTATGKELAGRFEMADGLVISSPGGGVQALRQTGTVSGPELTSKLTQYAGAAQPVAAAPVTTYTLVNGQLYTSGQPVVGGSPVYTTGVVSGSCPGGNCGVVAPASYYAPAPVFNFPGSSCPNGRCPNQR